MSDPQPPWHDPEPSESSDWKTLLFGLIGLIMLLPGLCAIIGISQNPTILLPHSRAAPLFWLCLAIGASGVALLWVARSRRR